MCLGGRAMEVVYDEAMLADYIARATRVSPEHPILIDKFLDNAIELDVDALCDGTDIYIGGIMEHIEEAGIHSGDSACVLPPRTLSAKDLEHAQAIYGRARQRTECPRSYQYPICDSGRHHLYSGSQSARQPYRPLRFQSNGSSSGQDCRETHGRTQAQGFIAADAIKGRTENALGGGQRSGASLVALPRCGRRPAARKCGRRAK